MAEGDTVHRTARALERALAGKTITDVAVPNPRSPLRRQTRLVERLIGSRMTTAEARGKHLLLHFEPDLVLHSHLGMRGSWRVVGAGERGARDARAWVALSAADVTAVELEGSR